MRSPDNMAKAWADSGYDEWWRCGGGLLVGIAGSAVIVGAVTLANWLWPVSGI